MGLDEITVNSLHHSHHQALSPPPPPNSKYLPPPCLPYLGLGRSHHRQEKDCDHVESLAILGTLAGDGAGARELEVTWQIAAWQIAACQIAGELQQPDSRLLLCKHRLYR